MLTTLIRVVFISVSQNFSQSRPAAMNIVDIFAHKAFLLAIIGFAASAAILTIVLVAVLENEPSDSSTMSTADPEFSTTDDQGSGFEETTDFSSSLDNGSGDGSGQASRDDPILSLLNWHLVETENRETQDDLDMISEGFMRV